MMTLDKPGVLVPAQPARAASPPADALDVLLWMVACLKGGTGKSTTAWMLLCELARRGYRALGVDADSNSQTLIDRYRTALERHGGQVPFDVISWSTPDGMVEGLRREMAARGATALIVDVGGHDLQNMLAAGLVCDTLIVPVAPTPDDIKRVHSTWSEAANVNAISPIEPYVLLTQCHPTSRDAAEARAHLEGYEWPNGHVGYPVLRAQVPYSVAYPRLAGWVTDETGPYSDVADELGARPASEVTA